MARRSRQLTTLNAPDRRFVVVNSDRAERPSAGHGPNIARLPATIARTERTVATRGGCPNIAPGNRGAPRPLPPDIRAFARVVDAVGVRGRERARAQTARAKKRNDVAGIRP